ncbi:PREDICTED: cap-specific mRNA (nucleoside-2'-O-)-methyltransferase 2 [Nanorana parkeri]|uniref:cap-specific mRNA (nucleoside-2'-O-)-methyltransferase 2 n=1 Tax=Nanorana parkeri TaxID=125878 RepID=UPI000854CC1E|nr:PREDICTED: cap-specific mRNA (nucleoside-2'-O-)-methyltransferase 2 [Nanorana parkeri]
MSGGDFPHEIQSLFEKRYAYNKDPTWRLPGSTEILTSDHEEFPRLLSLKESLNKVKNLLSDKKLDEWHRHTAYTNKAGRVVPEVRKQANAELCTQAWCKFHEIVSTYRLIPDSALWYSELNSVHLCEAPGAFISSLNHYVKTRELHCDWTWVGNTLNPYHEANDGMVMIADDRFIANTLPWWFFGPDNTGDIMTLTYLSGLQDFLRNVSAVHLVTADGSFDCQSDPGEQETLVYPLHYCEVVTCLTILSPGGSFVLKMFTFLQHSSINLVYLLNCCFREVHVIKPGTSKAGNSEVYVVCLGYIGSAEIREHLTKMAAQFEEKIGSKSLFSHKDLPPSFLEAHSACCTFFHEYQTQTILENLRLFSQMGEGEQAHLDRLRESAVLYYLQSFQIAYIPRKRWLVRKPRVGCSLNARWLGARNRRTDTYNERKQLEALTWEEKVARGYFSSWLEDHVQGVASNGCLLEGSRAGLRHDDWYVLRGRRLTRIQSSSFCDSELLNTFNETIESCRGGEAGSLPGCPSCSPQLLDSLVSEVLCRADDGHHVLVIGASPLFDALRRRHVAAGFVESSAPQQPLSVLHDGDPHYQRQLFDSVLCALRQLPSGGTLVLPILSSLTRFTAGVVYVLYHCFKVIGFSCPTKDLTPGTSAVLLCWGYHPLPRPVYQRLQQLLTDPALTAGGTQQMLEFIPMEELLTGPFLEFLWDLNAVVIRHKLHLMALRENQKVLRKTGQSQTAVTAPDTGMEHGVPQ